MSIWILAAVCAVLLGVAGYFLGVIRALVTMIGTLIGIAIADSIREPVAEKVIPALFHDLSFWKINLDMKFYHEFWRDGAAPILGAFLISLVFLGIGFGIHHMFVQRYTNRATEVQKIRWTNMSRGWGLLTGFVWALVWVTFISNLVYFPGYATVQLTNSSDPAKGLGLLNNLRKDLNATGMDDVVAPWDDTSDSVYAAIDFAGLMYANPRDELRYRLSAYPLFLGKTRDGSALAEAVKDDEINDFFASKGNIVTLYENNAFKDVINSQELSEPIEDFYPNDIRQFLETGVSARREHRIVGRWRFDPGATSLELRREMGNVARSVLGVVLQGLMEMQARIVATPEGDFYLEPKFPSERIAALNARYEIENPELVSDALKNLVSSINRDAQLQWEDRGHEFIIGSGANQLTGLVVDGDLKLTDRQGRTYVFYPDD